MPLSIAREILDAYERKRRKDPSADRATLYKHLLWDRFQGRMILDEELEDMARNSANLLELTLRVLEREKPNVLARGLRGSVEHELNLFFKLNAPGELQRR